jgi:hypothetical protein
MPRTSTTLTLQSIDGRVAKVEQILPTLATKQELAEAIVPLATREEVRAEGVETRRHFDVVAESIGSELRMFGEEHIHLRQRLDGYEAKTDRSIASLDLRVLRLAAERGRPTK